jgi:hypothetical protein
MKTEKVVPSEASPKIGIVRSKKMRLKRHVAHKMKIKYV